jgi:hypothetical protein
MAVRLSALCACRPLPPGRFLVLISVRGWVDLRAIVRLEGLRQLKNPMTSSGIEPATFRLVACCLNELQRSWKWICFHPHVLPLRNTKRSENYRRIIILRGWFSLTKNPLYSYWVTLSLRESDSSQNLSCCGSHERVIMVLEPGDDEVNLYDMAAFLP